MKSIRNWLKTENIHLGLESESELGALRMMIKLAVDTPYISDEKQFSQAVLDSEVYGSALSGCCNISFYAVTDSISEPLFIFGRFDKGIGYYSKHQKPIDLISLLSVPPGQETKLADTLFMLHNFLCQHEYAEKIRQAKTKTEVYQIFENLK